MTVKVWMFIILQAIKQKRTELVWSVVCYGGLQLCCLYVHVVHGLCILALLLLFSSSSNGKDKVSTSHFLTRRLANSYTKKGKSQGILGYIVYAHIWHSILCLSHTQSYINILCPKLKLQVGFRLIERFCNVSRHFITRKWDILEPDVSSMKRRFDQKTNRQSCCTMTLLHSGFSVFMSRFKSLHLELLSCIRVIWWSDRTKNKHSGCFYLKPQTGEWKGVGRQPDLPSASVCNGRWRRRSEREGNYFLDMLKRKVLPLWPDMRRSTWQTHPVPLNLTVPTMKLQ